MATVKYGDGTLYGALDAYYGRISADLQAAQLTAVRETGLRVRIVDENTNQWEYFAGTDVDFLSKETRPVGSADPKLQTYYSYRGRVDMCVLDNGNIVRVRNNVSTRDVEYQVITDPTVAAQWESWTTYNTDDNYAVCVAPDTASTYIIYHIKSDGLYRNNVKVWSKTGLMRVTCHRKANNQQQKDALWLVHVSAGMLHPTTNKPLRKFDIYVTEDVMSVTPDITNWSYVWQRSEAASITRDDGSMVRITSFPQYAPIEAINSGESLVSLLTDTWAEMDDALRPRLIRGIPGTAGHNHVSGVNLCHLSDGYYYLFYQEFMVSEDYEITSNLKYPIVWQRSKDAIHWSEPVHAGTSFLGFGGVVEKDDWVYMSGNGSIWRRPSTTTEHDISNYIPSLEWDSPRDNQTGNGHAIVANPNGINNYLLDLSDKRIIIEPGMKVGGGNFEFARLDDHWIQSVEEQRDGEISRLKINFGNLWSRLENPLRDVYNFIGLTEYNDWGVDHQNEMFNYFFTDNDSDPSVTNNQLTVPGGAALWTAWKGYNPFVQIRRSGNVPMSIVYRWVDADNHMKATYDGNTVKLYEVVDGTATQIGVTRTVGSIQDWGIRVVWKIVELWVNGSFVNNLASVTTQDTPNVVAPGYAGFLGENGSYTVWDFRFKDQEHDFRSNDMIKQALALGDYHDAVVASSNERQYALAWGPQTDIPTAADGLRQMLEADKLELVWRDGVITVGKFAETTPRYTLENRVINTSFINEGDRRINTALIDGNEHSWLEIDSNDILDRDRAINAYFDLPELTTQDSVRIRALEEIRRGKMGLSPGGTVPLFFDIWRMDPIEWVDNAGTSRIVRIEGMRVIINQSDKPSQRQELDTSLIS